jgi:CRISPR/Cas system CMR subunit Cmr4 (Cas7 group RAMP superfamily)
MSAGWHVARITFRAISPLSVAAGEGVEADNALARSADGLPMVPGASLQGVLRSFHRGSDLELLFGSAFGGDARTPARLYFGNAHVHDSHGSTGFFPRNLSDPLLAILAAEAPLLRDHVRLDHRGTAAKAGKFDRAAVPAGACFSFELRMFGRKDEGDRLDRLLAPLADPGFRLGGRGRRGYGRIELVSARRGFFAADAKGALALRTLREKPLSEHGDLPDEIPFAPASNALTIALTLNPLNPWRSGQTGARARTGKSQQGFPEWTRPMKKVGDDYVDRAADLAPLREPRIRDGALLTPSGDDQQHYVLPASAIAGPLLHRTLYHWNRLNGMFVDPDDEGAARSLEKALDNRQELDDLFGTAAGGGRASALIFEDVALTVTSVAVADHNKIDRFTGGSYQGALYSEELIETEQIRAMIRLDPRRIGDVGAGQRNAFCAALRDLTKGRLALGAKSYGFCTGDAAFDGPEGEVWRTAFESGGAADD